MPQVGIQRGLQITRGKRREELSTGKFYLLDMGCSVGCHSRDPPGTVILVPPLKQHLGLRHHLPTPSYTTDGLQVSTSHIRPHQVHIICPLEMTPSHFCCLIAGFEHTPSSSKYVRLVSLCRSLAQEEGGIDMA